jgi:hypothetical protein
MKRTIALICLLLTVLLVGCDAYSPAFVNDSPPIRVPVMSGNVSGTLTGTVDIQQDVIADPNNSSSANITAGATFTGTSTSTLGIVGIQVSIKTDRDCTVYVDQSPTDSGAPNWDITDTYNYTSSLGGASWTTQAVNSYVRVRVKNITSANTTYLRLQTCLCPIVEAVPRSLSTDGRLKTQTTITDVYGFGMEMTPFNELRVAQSIKLAGTVFIGATLDTNFISINTTGTGAVTQGQGQMTLATGGGANGYSEAFSVRRGRFVAGNSNMAKEVVQIPDSGTTNNKRRWGIGDLPGSGNYTLTDGAYFKIDGTTFSVNTLRGSVETQVASGSFNGNYGTSYTVDNLYHVYEIYYSQYKVYFSLDGKLLHTVDANSAPWTNTVTLYVGMDNTNYNGSTTNVTMQCESLSIHRLGVLVSAPIYKHISTATTTVLKYGAGTLHRIILGNPTNNDITLYDNTGGSGSIIGIIRPSTVSTPFELDYEIDFYTGLTIVTAGTPDLTVVYE